MVKKPPAAQGVAEIALRERAGHQAGARQDGGADQQGSRFPHGRGPPSPAGLHIAAKDLRRTDGPDAQQRRHGEQQGHQAGDADALNARQRVPGGRQVDGEIPRDHSGEGRRHRHPEDRAQHAARQAQHQGLHGVDADHLRRARPQALHHGDGIELLLQVAVHGAGHPHGADHQRDQPDQAEEGGGAVQAARDDGVRLAVIGDGGFGERPLEHVRARLPHGAARAAGKAEQVALGGAAAQADQAGAVEALRG